MQIKTEKKPTKSTQGTCNTVHETHILKIMSFISSRVNHPGSVGKYNLTE